MKLLKYNNQNNKRKNCKLHKFLMISFLFKNIKVNYMIKTVVKFIFNWNKIKIICSSINLMLINY